MCGYGKDFITDIQFKNEVILNVDFKMLNTDLNETGNQYIFTIQK